MFSLTRPLEGLTEFPPECGPPGGAGRAHTAGPLLLLEPAVSGQEVGASSLRSSETSWSHPWSLGNPEDIWRLTVSPFFKEEIRDN